MTKNCQYLGFIRETSLKLLSSSIFIHPLSLHYRISKTTLCNIGNYSSVMTTLWLRKRSSLKNKPISLK